VVRAHGQIGAWAYGGGAPLSGLAQPREYVSGVELEEALALAADLADIDLVEPGVGVGAHAQLTGKPITSSIPVKATAAMAWRRWLDTRSMPSTWPSRAEYIRAAPRAVMVPREGMSAVSTSARLPKLATSRLELGQGVELSGLRDPTLA
jgi:hypothetical protein